MPFIFILFVVIAIAFAIYGWQAERKRREELAAWALSHRLTFDPSKDRGFDDRYPSFGCFRSGSNRYAYNRSTGDWNGRRLCAFDYHYETHSTDSKGRSQTHHHHFSGVMLSSAVPLKPLSIRPEHFFDKVTEFFGFDDIDFESAEFSRRFYVKSPDRKWAYDVLHPRAMQRLLDKPVFSIVFDPSCVLAYRSSRFRTVEFEQAIDVAAGLLDGLPDYLVRAQGGRPPPLGPGAG